MCCDSSADLSDQTQKILVIGLGNPILGDDGVGWHIIRASQGLFKHAGDPDRVHFQCSSAGGLALMEQMVGYDAAILTDSVITAAGQVGAIHSEPFSSLPHWGTGHFNSSHDTTLQTAVDTGRKMHLDLPTVIWLVAVEIRAAYTFSETLSSAVAAAVPEAAKLVLEKLNALDGQSL